MASLFSLKGQVALVTGATNGIGLGYAKGLAGADIDQIILTYRSKETLDKAIEVIKGVNSNVRVDGVVADFLSEDLDSVIDNVITEAYEIANNGKIDILVNNAGIQHRYPFEEFPEDVFDSVISVNLKVPVKLTQQVGKKMLQDKTKGKIIFTASLNSFQGGFQGSAYSVSKGGIKLFTSALSNEWAGRGIRVNAIAPGYIETKLTDTMDPTVRSKVIDRIPMGRWGHIDDFQGPVVFLASDASLYITGETLLVDGGWMSR